MADKLTVIGAEVLSPEEKTELSTNIDRIIAEHKNNRQEINRLVFQSVAAMTEADDAQVELENKGFFRRFIGGITGSNQKLQNRINHNRAAAQYAAQQTLQKLAEQNLMTFDLITAVNNKLNASLYAVNEEFSKIYTGLEKFFKNNRNEMVRLETRLAKVEQNVQLLTWQNSIEYLDFDGEEYLDMDDTKKIVCLVRDFYDITQGKWSTSDLLLLKTAMATIGIQPKSKVNYFGVLREIENNTALKDKLLNGMEIRPITEPGYLIAMSTLKKMDSLQNEESYMINTLGNYMKHYGVEIDHEQIYDDLTNQYLKEKALVNINIDVESYDMILDLLYNLKQAEDEDLLLLSGQDSRIHEAEQAYLQCRFQEAFDMFNFLAESGNARAMYFLGIFYRRGYGNVVEIDTEKGNRWTKKGMEAGDPLCVRSAIGMFPMAENKKKQMLHTIWDELVRLAESGNPFAQFELACAIENDEEKAQWMEKSAEQGYRVAQYHLGGMYQDGRGVTEDYEEAIKWYRKAAEQGYASAQNNLGLAYMHGLGVTQDSEEGIKWLRKASEQGDTSACNNLGITYERGYGIPQNYEEAVKWYRKGAEQGDVDCQGLLGNMYERGAGVPQNYEEAVKWYQNAAEQGNAWCQGLLGNMYEHGNGVPQDTEKAMKCYQMAAEQGRVDAMVKLGNLCAHEFEQKRKGLGTDDYKDAMKWYRKAAEQGSAEAQYRLGYLYFHEWAEQPRWQSNDEIKYQCQEAMKWLKKASGQQYPGADSEISKLSNYIEQWHIL